MCKPEFLLMLQSLKARRTTRPGNHRSLLSTGTVFLLAQIVLAQGELSFDGVNDRVMVPYDSSFPTETFTIGAWIKLPTPARRSAIIARGEDNNSFNLSWQLYVSPGGLLEIMLEDANENNYCYPVTCMGQPQPSCVAGNRFVGDNEWHHVAGTRDASGELVLYIDGQPVTACQQTGVPSSNNFQFLTIGCTHGTIGPPPGGIEPPVWFFAGLIDEPAMWNVALTGAEIVDVYLNGVNPTSPGLVGYWAFNEGTGADTAGTPGDVLLLRASREQDVLDARVVLRGVIFQYDAPLVALARTDFDTGSQATTELFLLREQLGIPGHPAWGASFAPARGLRGTGLALGDHTVFELAHRELPLTKFAKEVTLGGCPVHRKQHFHVPLTDLSGRQAGPHVIW